MNLVVPNSHPMKVVKYKHNVKNVVKYHTLGLPFIGQSYLPKMKEPWEQLKSKSKDVQKGNYLPTKIFDFVAMYLKEG
jgi:hypothetical protein